MFKFLELQESIGFVDAVKMLAQRFGLAIPELAGTDEQRASAAEREGLLNAHEAAAAWFREEPEASLQSVIERVLEQLDTNPDRVRAVFDLAAQTASVSAHLNEMTWRFRNELTDELVRRLRTDQQDKRQCDFRDDEATENAPRPQSSTVPPTVAPAAGLVNDAVSGGGLPALDTFTVREAAPVRPAPSRTLRLSVCAPFATVRESQAKLAVLPATVCVSVVPPTDSVNVRLPVALPRWLAARLPAGRRAAAEVPSAPATPSSPTSRPAVAHRKLSSTLISGNPSTR